MSESTPVDVIEGRARFCVVCSDCRDVLPTIPDKSVNHTVCDPPYSRRTHTGMRGNRGKDGIVTRDCGFEHLTPALRRFIAHESVRTTKGWIAMFTDRESSWMWRVSLEAAGGHYKRTVPWIRWSSPQFNRLAPPSACEDVVWAAAEKGLFFWDTDLMSYDSRCLRASNKKGDHETEKSELLMMELLSGCAKPGDIVADWTCGSGSTLVAALRMGCQVIGTELRPEHAAMARDRCAAEADQSDVKSRRAGQCALFGE